MSTRNSGFARVPADLYQTPAWVLDALAEHVNLNGRVVWEPACGEGKMTRALEAHGAQVFATDLNDHGFGDMAMQFDFTAAATPGLAYFEDIITNPAYGPGGRLAERFIKVGLERLRPGGVLALLLQVDFDSGSTRRRFFRDCPDYAGAVVLNKRIEWFPPEPGQSGPSANHAWFIWHRRVLRPSAPPFRVYAPSPDEVAA